MQVVAVVVAYQPALPALTWNKHGVADPSSAGDHRPCSLAWNKHGVADPSSAGDHRPCPLSRLLDVLQSWSVPVVVVDNGSAAAVGMMLQQRQSTVKALAGMPGLSYLPQASNQGIARAHNLGAAQAFAQGAEAVWLLDQDSTPDRDCLPALVSCLQTARLSSPVAAVVPQFVDEEAARAGSYLCFNTNGVVTRTSVLASGEPHALAAAIASGMLIPKKAWECIGPMCDALFIDCVDTEWCFRAHHHRWRVLLAPGAKMAHCIGGALTPLWPGSLRRVRLRPALRNFYLFRNGLWLARMAHCPPGWLRVCLTQMLRLSVLALCHGPLRLQQSAAIWRGISAGLLDPLPEKRTIP